MKKILFYLVGLSMFCSCNDGDIIVTTFDFTETPLDFCGETGDYVFFNINSETNESISLSINTTETLFESIEPQIFTIDGNNNIVYYRKYSNAPDSDYFCSNVPPTSPTVTKEYIGSSGQGIVTNTITLDDQDGIEELDLEMDTDLDGIPNYYDFDDDGDNVPTILELGADYLNEITETPQDSDGDGTPDYLDPDDDNDGVLTRYEDENQDLDPTNDLTDGIANYLNNTIITETIIDIFREHNYNFRSDISLTLTDLQLINGEEEITQETMFIGSIENIINREEITTPNFPED
ncbi:MAG: hypothetical protein ACWA45_11025 [Flavobacteriales bacterium]